MSILRWNFKAKMDATISSSDNGQIALENGYEVAFISLLAGENDFRYPESLPCLHDKVLQAAADTAISFSAHQKKKKVTAPGILGGITKGLKGGVVHSVDHSANPRSNFTHLEGIFSSSPFLDPYTENHEVEELTLDDIIIDEPIIIDELVSVASTSSHKIKNDKKGKGNEREKLFEGATADMKPRQRTPEEIIAKYRKMHLQRLHELVQRQEKLEEVMTLNLSQGSGSEKLCGSSTHKGNI